VVADGRPAHHSSFRATGKRFLLITKLVRGTTSLLKTAESAAMLSTATPPLTSDLAYAIRRAV